MSLVLDNALKRWRRTFVYLVEVGHPQGTAWFNTGFRDLEYDAGDGEKTWLGVSLIGDLSLPEESGAIEITEYEARLAGVEAAYQYLTEDIVRGYAFNVWIAFLGDDREILATEQVAQDTLDRVWWEEGEDGKGAIVLAVSGNMPFLSAQKIDRVDPEHQAAWLSAQGEDPDSDTGFDRQYTQPDENEAWYPPS